MAETKWTPGPWAVENTATCGVRLVHGEADPQTGFRDDVNCQRGALAPAEDSLANLHLCAAAPDLYAALELVDLHFHRNQASGEFQGDDEHEAWAAVIAAMKRARGEV